MFIAGSGTKSSPTNYLFTDKKLNSGKYNYRLKQKDCNGGISYFKLNGTIEVCAPLRFEVSQNYPNPFNSVSKIDFDLPVDCYVNITLYDPAGREIKTIFDGAGKQGFHTVKLEVPDLSSGLYFYRIIASSPELKYAVTKKMILLK
ncbi:MAG: T9SS type A sorting domain-containing protein [Bacteroidetes bacterium]|nr:T9SS type A sorting domain-containing protein [Bacteroidota bacterium]